MNAIWFAAFGATMGLALALNSMVVLAVMVGPLLVLHVWIALRETRP